MSSHVTRSSVATSAFQRNNDGHCCDSCVTAVADTQECVRAADPQIHRSAIVAAVAVRSRRQLRVPPLSGPYESSLRSLTRICKFIDHRL